MASAEPGVTFFGHAMARIELPGGSVVTDPVLRRRVAFLEWVAPQPSLAALDSLDAVLVSHLHHDHCDLPSLRQLGRDRLLVVPAGTGTFFLRRGFTDVAELRPGDSLAVGGLTVTATPAAHDGRRRPAGPPTSRALGYLVEGGGLTVYFAGDTAAFPRMADLCQELTVALLPVAGWGRTMGPGHLDPWSAAQALTMLRPEVAVPIHWGAFRPVWQRDAPQVTDRPAVSFAKAVMASRAPSAVVALLPGTSFRIRRFRKTPEPGPGARAAAPPPPPWRAMT
jgi:L-ascorbate metabolism protein UlaG (beta-lactamase superfamily)